jgi:hypothetical protein
MLWQLNLTIMLVFSAGTRFISRRKKVLCRASVMYSIVSLLINVRTSFSFKTPHGQEIFLFSKTSRPALRAHAASYAMGIGHLGQEGRGLGQNG